MPDELLTMSSQEIERVMYTFEDNNNSIDMQQLADSINMLKTV